MNQRQLNSTGTRRSPIVVSGVEFHFTSSDIESVFVDAADWSDRAAARPPAPAAGELRDPVAGPPIIVDTDNRPFEDITLESEGISVEDILGIDDGMHELGDDNSPTDEFEVLRDVPDSAVPGRRRRTGRHRLTARLHVRGREWNPRQPRTTRH